MKHILYPDFDQIVMEAWKAYDPTRTISEIKDISAKVSTNHVYRIVLEDQNYAVAKLSFFGTFKNFTEDHSIINSLSNNLPAPFENFLARALMKGDRLFVHHHQKYDEDVWVVFYRPIKFRHKLPRRLSKEQIIRLGMQAAQFHKACKTVRKTLPKSTKTMKIDIVHLQKLLEQKEDPLGLSSNKDFLMAEIDKFLTFYPIYRERRLPKIPVFIDWNIGNFSVTKKFRFYSRWDYDWFRVSTRVQDFYFFSRVVSDVGDRTVFTYNASTLMEGRFKLFLKAYHKINPLTAFEIDFIPQAYRFFLLNYVIKYGNYFFQENYARKLQREALTKHLPTLDEQINPEILKKAIGL